MKVKSIKHIRYELLTGVSESVIQLHFGAGLQSNYYINEDYAWLDEPMFETVFKINMQFYRLGKRLFWQKVVLAKGCPGKSFTAELSWR